MRKLLAILLLLCPAFAQTTPRAVEVLRAFDQLAQEPLWPGFEPAKIAVELYDGTDTYLYHHPKPPEGFTAVPGAPGVSVFHGQHDSVRANTGTELNGVPTATADISKNTRPPRETASLLIHETFHVYEKAAHPKWAANEAELFTYPFDNAEVLGLRRTETVALVAALDGTGPRVLCWSAAAVRYRQQRFSKLPQGAAGYERGIELNEGLAQYVEYKSVDKSAAISEDDFPVELIRQRGYASGQAWALLLDRLAPGWQTSVDSAVGLDELLATRLVALHAPTDCVLDGGLVGQVEFAKQEVQQVLATRAQRKHAFLSAPGWRVEIVAGAEPLWPQGFDPWNVQNLGDNDILHTRWVKIGNKSGALEVLNHASMTEGVGPHPLFNGAKRLIITGLAPVSFNDKDGKVEIISEGAKGTFAGASVSVSRQGQAVTVQLP